MNNNIIITQGIVIPENAKVLLCFGAVEFTDEEAGEMKDKLKERFPTAEFTFAFGATGIAIMNDDVQKVMETKDDLPHSRACGLYCNGHVSNHPEVCSKDCPTCHGSKDNL